MAVDRDKVLQAAQKHVERKRYDRAIAEYQKLVDEDPRDVRTWLKIGDLHLKVEDYIEAITTYERVGQFYSTQGHALKAIAVYKQIREIIHKYVPHQEDRFGHIVPRLAEIYSQLGLTSDALAAYDEVATRLQKSGRERDAIDILRKVVDLDPESPVPYLRLAEALVKVKDFDNAVIRFGSAAEILLKIGRRDDALKVVERLLQHRPEPRFARKAAEIYLDRGEPSDAMAALTKLQISFKENPKDLETLTLVARAFDKLGQPTRSIEVQKEMARIAKEAGRVDQFAALVASLIARAPDDEEVRQLAAQLKPSSMSDPRASIEVRFDDDEDEPSADEGPPASAVPLRPGKSKAAIPPYDPAALARQVIAQAENHRAHRQFDQAIDVLRRALQNLPSARNLHEKLCDLLIETGDQDGAIAQMLAFAQQLAEEQDIEAAARVLDEVLLLEPDHQRAIEMLRSLGYEVAPAQPSEQPQTGDYQEYVEEIPTGDIVFSEPDEPLPRYPIDEDHPQVVTQAEIQARQRASSAQITTLDDPFGQEPGPLPQFNLDDEATRYMQPPPSVVAPPMPSQPPPMEPISAPILSQRAAALDEDALEEVEFFMQHGMFDDARGILEEQLTRLPNHRLLMERLHEVMALAEQARAPADNQSGTRVVPQPGSEDRAYDIAEALKSIDELDVFPGQNQPAPIDDSGQISAETVFQQFKAGVAAQISPSDAATHYDLGLAYKEMGLFTDAISEFELASRDPARECVCQSMIGSMYLALGNIEAGIDALIRGLHASDKTMDQELALTYEIANAYEMRANRDQALYYFQRVARLNAGYQDPRGNIADRIRRLEAPRQPARAAVNAPMVNNDDFDLVFDDLLSSGKLP